MTGSFRIVLPVLFLASVSIVSGQTRDQKVRADKEKVVSEGFWIYNDLDAATEKAKRTGKPMLVVLRCIPCEECVKLDDDLVDKDPVIRPLLEQFVCVRQVSTNGLNLDLFQYDTDQSFAIFMLNANGTIYGRFGTRSHRTHWFGDVSLKGLAKTLQAGLDLHSGYPANRETLAGKRGEPLEFGSPEKYPSLKEKYTDQLNYSGDVVRSCIHCHQIGDARRELHWSRGEPIPDTMLFPYPHPKSLGLILDPDQLATVKEVKEDSIASQAGFRKDDRIISLAGQPMLSIADVQWVLNGVPAEGGELTAKIERDGKTGVTRLKLTPGWRQLGDISWRVSTWPLRRMVTGGLVLQPLSQDERAEAGVRDGTTALLVKHVGQYGPHSAGKRAGFREGDIVTGYDGKNDLLTEADLMRHAINHHRIGDKVSVTVKRGDQETSLKLPVQR